MAILIFDKMVFQSKSITRDRESHKYVKGLNSSRRYKNCKYIYASNMRTPNYIKQLLKELNQEINSNTIIIVDFETPLSNVDNHPDIKSIRRQQA